MAENAEGRAKKLVTDMLRLQPLFFTIVTLLDENAFRNHPEIEAKAEELATLLNSEGKKFAGDWESILKELQNGES
jgi:hypothetical protein